MLLSYLIQRKKGKQSLRDMDHWSQVDLNGGKNSAPIRKQQQTYLGNMEKKIQGPECGHLGILVSCGPKSGIISLLSGSVFTQSSFENRSSIGFDAPQKILNVIHLVFQSKPLSWSQLFLCLHVSCKRNCPTPRANYSLFQDFLYYDLFFWRKHPQNGPFFNCSHFAPMTEGSLLSLTKKPNTIWSELSPSSVLEVRSNGNKLFMVCNNVNYPTFPIDIHFLSFFILFSAHYWRAGKHFPDGGNEAAGDLEIESCFIST